jgi:EpsD family peptidyl-prolyl cis-trans isomerase
MKTLGWLFWGYILLFICGCSSQSAKESSGSVAAVVNGVEITQAEIEYFAKKSTYANTNQAAALEQKKAVLSNLIRAELLSQKAHELGIDKDPDFTIALYEARRQVLAGMAESRLLKDAKPVTPEIAKTVVENNPRIFSDRKLLVYEEILIQGVDVPFLKSLIAMVDNGATTEQLVEVLKSNKKIFQKTIKSQTSDQLQPVFLDTLLKSKLEKPLIARIEDKISMIMVLHQVRPVPLLGEQAIQTAMVMVNAQQRNALLSKSMNDLINTSKITYFGDYAKPSTGKRNVINLPSPDKQQTKKLMYQGVIRGAILSVSCIFALLALTASMRILRGRMWLPRLWSSSSISEEPLSPYEWEYEAYLTEKFYIGFMALIIVAVLAMDIYLIIQNFSILVIIAGILSGILLGIAVSHIFRLEALQALSHKLYAILIAAFTVPVIIGLVVIMTHSGI